MTKKILFTTALVLAITAMAFGQGYGRGGNRTGGYGHMNDVRGMGYNMKGHNGGYGYASNPEELAKVEAINQKYFSEFEKIRANMFTKDSEMRVELNKDKPDQKKINSLIDQQSKLRADLDKLRFKMDTEIRAALGR